MGKSCNIFCARVLNSGHVRGVSGKPANHRVACEQAPGGASGEQTFAPNVCSALAPPGACSQANHRVEISYGSLLHGS